MKHASFKRIQGKISPTMFLTLKFYTFNSIKYLVKFKNSKIKIVKFYIADPFIFLIYATVE